MPLTEAQKRKIEEEENYRSQLATSKQSEQVKSSQKHGVPALLSFFIPGLGQIVKGQIGKGILTFIEISLGLIMLVIPGIIIWIWQIMDAYNN
jgi:TM2 domain-containing membrane protein YozV